MILDSHTFLHVFHVLWHRRQSSLLPLRAGMPLSHRVSRVVIATRRSVL